MLPQAFFVPTFLKEGELFAILSASIVLRITLR